MRNAEGGTKRAWDARFKWTPLADVAKGTVTPWEVLDAGRCRAGAARETLEGNEAYERMNPRAQVIGGRRLE